MRSDVLQAVALCCHSAKYLSESVDHPPELLANSTFLPVHEVKFERTASGRVGGGLVADATGPWLRRLNKEGVARLSVTLAGCPFDPLATPAEPWGIRSDGDVGVEIWQPDWKKRLRTYSDPSPWKVAYVSTRSTRWNPNAVSRTFYDCSQLLSAAIREGSRVHRLVDRLMHGDEVSYPDLFPADWPTEQRELGLQAANVAAFVRSEAWAQVLLLHELTAADHEAISQKLWKSALLALEASVKVEAVASAHPTSQSYRLAG